LHAGIEANWATSYVETDYRGQIWKPIDVVDFAARSPNSSVLVEHSAMRKRSKNQSASKPFRRPHLCGAPPILEGEDSKAYDEILDRVFGAIGPTDFIEEIWVRDLVDVTWEMLRWRRILAALVSEQVSESVNDEAASLAEAQTEMMEGPEKADMEKLPDSDSEFSWETLVAKYPRANKKFQELWSSAESTLDKDLIQARVMNDNLDMIERVNNLIMIAQRRIDEVIRELDRHRFMQKQLNSFQDRQPPKLETAEPKLIEGKATNKKIA
jgi:hypothetical protein